MKKYEFFEHTADSKFRAYGESLEECFSNAAEAMCSIMYKTEDIKPKKQKDIEVAGTDLKSLLYNFLEEIIVLLDTDSLLINHVAELEITKNEKYYLKAKLFGDIYSEEYSTHGDVKAITYNEMEINKNPLFVQVVVDI